LRSVQALPSGKIFLRTGKALAPPENA